MRKLIINYAKGLFALILLLQINPSKAALSGTYTVNPSGSASSTNYQNLRSVVSDLISGTRSDGGTANGSGVNGAVNIEIYDGTYNEAMDFSAAITGASATNRVTFYSRSKDSSKVLITQPSSTINTNDFVLRLAGTDFVTFKQVTIRRTGTLFYSTVVSLSAGATNNEFLNCVLWGRNVPSDATTGFQVGGNSVIWCSGNDTGNLYKQNWIINGYNGFFQATAGGSNRILNNTFDSSGSSAVYALQQQRFIMEGNLVRLHPFKVAPYVSYGIRLETSPGFRIQKNKFYAMANAGVSRCVVLFANNSPSTNPGIVSNNFLLVTGGTTSSTGIAIGNNTNMDVVYNSVVMTSTVAENAAMFIYAPPQGAGSANNIMNNNFVCRGGGYCIDYNGASGSNIGGTDTCNYNNLYTNGQYIAREASTRYTTLAAWRAGVFLDANSISADPGFVSIYDMHATAIAVDGKAKPHPFVLDDIDGDTRSTSATDIGADEFTPVALDAGISSVDSPKYFCAGSQFVTTVFSNYGTATLTSLSVGWTLNGVNQTPFAWTGSVPSGSSSSSFRIGTFTASSNTTYNIKIWTFSPNGGTDGAHLNDTLTVIKRTGLSGAYTIGGTSPNYGGFNDAILALTERGICGPVVFNIRDGLYLEQISLPEFVGSSATNTVTWQSQNGDSSKVVISTASTTATGVNNATIQINGGDNNIIRKITIERTGTLTFANVIDIKARARNNTFEGCRIIGKRLTGAIATNNQNVISASDDEENIVFRGNLFKYGNTGIYMTDGGGYEKGILIEGNVFDSCMTNAVHLANSLRPIIRNNIITNTGFANTLNNAPILLDYADSGFVVWGNQIRMNNGGRTAVYVQNAYGSAAKAALIANNFITLSASSATAYQSAVELGDAEYVDIDHNSVLITNISSVSVNSASGIYTTNAIQGIRIRNNLFINRGGGYALNIDNSTAIAQCDYNSLYSNSSSLFARYLGTNYGSLSAWTTNSGFDSHSVNINPTFVSGTDLHLTSANIGLYSKGTATPRVVTDFDGNFRNPVFPDLGADETVRNNDIGASNLDSLKTTICRASYRIVLNIRNFGLDTSKSYNYGAMIYSSTGALLQNYSSSSTRIILPNSALGGFYLGTYNFNTVGTYKIKIWTSNPNNKTDENIYNDTQIINFVVLNPPTATIQGASVICPREVKSYKVTKMASGTYSWSISGGSIVAGNGTDSIRVQAGTTGNITLKVKLNNGGCEDSSTINISINPLPNSSISGKDTACVGGTAIYGSAGQANTTYNWSVAGGNVLSSGGSVNVRWGNFSGGSVKLIATSSLGCKDSTIKYITLNTLPRVGFVGDTVVCGGKNLKNYLVSFYTANNSYTWKNITETKTGSFSGVDSFKVAFGISGSNTLRLIATDKAGCKDSASKNITVQPIAKASFKASALNATDYNFVADDTTLNTYSWDFGDTKTGNGFRINHTYPAPKNKYLVTLRVTDSKGCTNFDTQTIYIGWTSIAGISNQAKISIYPNPTQDVINIQVENGDLEQVRILDINGKVFIQENAIRAEFNTLNIATLPAGYYLLETKISGVTSRLRIQKL